jgi:hypothetical protein
MVMGCGREIEDHGWRIKDEVPGANLAIFKDIPPPPLGDGRGEVPLGI